MGVEFKDDDKQQFRTPKAVYTLCGTLTAVGLICFLIGLGTEPARAWGGWLMGAFFTTGMALFGLFMLGFGNLSSAGWYAAIKRVPEAMTSFFPAALVLVLIMCFVTFYAMGDNKGMKYFYEWTHDHGHGDHHADGQGHGDEGHSDKESHSEEATSAVADDSGVTTVETLQGDTPNSDSHDAVGALAPRHLSKVGYKHERHERHHRIHAYLLENGFKHAWLQKEFFIVRMIFYFLIWTGLAWLLVKNSRDQDETGAFKHTKNSVRISAVGMILLALSVTLASFDMIMSLDAAWFSTMFGAYRWIGLFLAGNGALAVLLYLIRRMGYMQSVTDDHIHNVGMWLKASAAFWAYIWFCQLLLIWYSNIPEETVYYVQRGYRAFFDESSPTGWGLLSFVLTPLLCFVIPFFFLLQRRWKRNNKRVAIIGVIAMLGVWLDLYTCVINPVTKTTDDHGHTVVNTAMVGIGDLSFLIFVGAFGIVFFKALERAPLFAKRDPYFKESLNHHI